MIFRTSKNAFSLIEVILAVALFGLLATALIGLLMNSYGSDVQAGDRDQAAIYAQQGIDAVWSIRRQAWNYLINGSHGLDQSSGRWMFNGNSDLIADRFNRVVTISDVCRDSSAEIVDCAEAGSLIDLETKQVTVEVTYTAINGVLSSVTLSSYLTNWQSRDWRQTDWVGGSGQTVWSDISKYNLDDGHVDVNTSGQVSLAAIAGSGCVTYQWPFTSQSDYVFNSNKISVNSGFAILKNQSAISSGSTTNAGFNSDTSNWTYRDWNQGGGEVNVAGNYLATGNNPGGGVSVTFPAGKNDELGGYWYQAIETTVSNPTAVVSFDYRVSAYDPTPLNFRVYVFVDSAPGEPTVGQEVWSSGIINGTQNWSSQTNIDVSSKVASIGTYYVKFAVWVETPNSNTGPLTVQFDNLSLSWSGSALSYPTDRPTINPVASYAATDLDSWSAFSEVASKDGGEIYYQLSADNGSTWQYWNGSGWSDAGANNYNTATIINSHLSAFTTSTGQLMFRAFLSSNGSQAVSLDEVSVSCAKNYTWPFSIAENYVYDQNKITVSGGAARLASQASVVSGQTTNAGLNANKNGWVYNDWNRNGGEVNPSGGRNVSGGNPGGYLYINVPKGRGDEVGGYWYQAFTTTAANPIATLNLDRVITAYGSTPIAFHLYAFVDPTPGAPVFGTQVWDSGEINATSGWQSLTNIDVSPRLTTARKYYLKVAVWVETPSTNTGPFTVGFDNISLSWSGNAGYGYPTDKPSILPSATYTANNIDNWTSFSEVANKNGGEIYYQLSADNGSTWKYWTGTNWAAAGANNYNTATDVNANINAFSTSTGQLMFRAFLASDGSQAVSLDSVQIGWGQQNGGNTGFQTSGYLISSAYDLGSNAVINLIKWNQVIPSCGGACNIKFQIRSAPDNGGSPGAWSSWYGATGSGSYFTLATGSAVSSDLNFNQWVQYRVELAGDGINTPILNDVTINYTPQ